GNGAMTARRLRRDWASATVLTAVVLLPAEAGAQTELPEIVVRTASPIVRRASAPPSPVTAPAAPAGSEQPITPPGLEPIWLGTLPIVTDQFATVTVVPQGEIERLGHAQLGDLLFNKPGITGSTFAPGASRPIVRGLDNYRVRLQENGIATGDVSDL